MKKIKYRIVYNRKKQLDSQGKALVQVEAYLSGKKSYFSTHIYLKPSQWSARTSSVCNHPHAEELNYMLEEFMLNLQMRELEAWKQGKEICLQLLKEIHEDTAVENKLIPFGRKWIENSPIRESTKSNLNTTLSLLETFSSGITFRQLDYKTLLSFEQFLKNKKLGTNTIAKHFRHIRTILNEAIRQGLITKELSPFTEYKIKTTESHHTYLLPEELEKLEHITLSRKRHALCHSLDAFLFCCYTGLRYSDFIRMEQKNFIQSDNGLWMVFKSQKTGAVTQLPLSHLFQGKAVRILCRYTDINDFFHIKPNASVNKDLIRIGKLAGLAKHFSFHTARHTNATLLLYKGVQLATVQKLLGHRNIKTTQVYGEVLPQTIVKELKKCKF
ncbi:site-specific recombinase phage integrase family [Bacteroides sp. CAG:1076]|jgi:integrase|nr:site-specific recombinase phage integrase family [Bacteroides sp. CAG:1076]